MEAPGGNRMRRIAKPGRLQLNKTTVRRLTNQELDQIAGGILKMTNACTMEGTCSTSCTCTRTCWTYSECPGGAV